MLLSTLKLWSEDLGFSHFGVTALKKPLSIEHYKSWLDRGLHADMKYLREHLPQKENPQLFSPKLRTALVFAHPYLPHPKPLPGSQLNARVALYARGEDYHFWLKNKLEQICNRLKESFPNEEFFFFTDSSPVLERDLAYRAGLGWIGKNSCLINPQSGSFHLLGEIYTSLEIQEQVELTHDFCGNCTRCIDICPTNALIEPRVLDSSKCISYMTIESRDVPKPEFRSQIGDWFFGCDLCQTVCPWNQKAFKKTYSLETSQTLLRTESSRADLVTELRLLMTLSGKQLQKKFHSSPLLRAGPFGLRRNAIVVAGNLKLAELTAEIQSLSDQEKLKELCLWALNQITQAPSSSEDH